jgi:hypothetical protein
MIDHTEARELRRPVRPVRPHLAVVDAALAARPGARVSAAAAAEHAAAWADGLAELVRVEIGDAQRCGVITAGEAEQLLARLVIVIDQAVVSRRAP